MIVDINGPDFRARLYSPRPLRILVDVDGVLADFVGLCQEVAMRHFGLNYRRESFERLWEHFEGAGLPGAESWAALRTWVTERQACAGMSLLPGAVMFYGALEGMGHHVRPCTSPLPDCPAWMSQRAEWLGRKLDVPPQHQIHIDDKASLAGAYDILIDDRAANCHAFERRGGKAWCVAWPYNATYEGRRGTIAECLDWLRAGAA